MEPMENKAKDAFRWDYEKLFKMTAAGIGIAGAGYLVYKTGFKAGLKAGIPQGALAAKLEVLDAMIKVA